MVASPRRDYLPPNLPRNPLPRRQAFLRVPNIIRGATALRRVLPAFLRSRHNPRRAGITLGENPLPPRQAPIVANLPIIPGVRLPVPSPLRNPLPNPLRRHNLPNLLRNLRIRPPSNLRPSRNNLAPHRKKVRRNHPNPPNPRNPVPRKRPPNSRSNLVPRRSNPRKVVRNPHNPARGRGLPRRLPRSLALGRVPPRRLARRRGLRPRRLPPKPPSLPVRPVSRAHPHNPPKAAPPPARTRAWCMRS